MSHTPGLDTLRAIAITWVMLFHSYFVGGLGEGFGELEETGWMGVDLFFVLSGYLIGSQVLRSLRDTGRLDLIGFYGRRCMRILPPFLVVLVLYVLWPRWREAPGMQPLWQFATFTFNLLFDNGQNIAFSHVWSLCVEEHFYLTFPMLALLLARRASTVRFVAVCAVIVVAGMALRAWLWTTQVGPARLAGAQTQLLYLRYLYYPTWSRLDGLVAGVGLAACRVCRPAWMARLHARSALVLVASLVLLGACVVLFDTGRAAFWPCVVGYPLLALAMAGLVAASSGTTWLARLRVPGTRWLAGASYSLYLSHKGMYHLTQGWLGNALADQPLLRFAAYAAATLAGGAVLHHAVERPCLRWRTRPAGSGLANAPAG